MQLILQSLLASLRLTVATLLICVGAYTGIILGFAHLAAPQSAEGSLIHGADGKIVGSRLLAQQFTQPGYFWPRPSAVDYNASGAGGSNKSPTNPALTERARGLISRYGANAEKPLPAELAAASGAGLDPHITEHAALYQAARVAEARHLTLDEVERLIKNQAFVSGGAFGSSDGADRIVNVLALNLALDASL